MALFGSIQQALQRYGYAQQQRQPSYMGATPVPTPTPGAPVGGGGQPFTGNWPIPTPVPTPAYAAEPTQQQYYSYLPEDYYTSKTPTSTTTPTGGGGAYNPPAPVAGTPSAPEVPSAPSGPSPEDIVNQGYGDYFAQLDAMLEQGLPAQRTAQEELARQQYTGGVEALQPQLQAGQTLLTRQRERTETSQARNLRDLSANLRNAFMTGNVFLGARGAGDSSAAQQYAYALTKLGSRQRGGIMTQTADIMREIGDRETNLNNIYNAEVNRLASERDQKITSLASWFAEQQNVLRQAKGAGMLGKSQSLLSIALNQLTTIQQESSNRRTALEQWAMNNSTSIQQVKANLQQVSAFQPSLPQAQPIVGQPISYAGGFNVPASPLTGYGAPTEEEERPLFSPPSYG